MKAIYEAQKMQMEEHEKEVKTEVEIEKRDYNKLLIIPKKE